MQPDANLFQNLKTSFADSYCTRLEIEAPETTAEVAQRYLEITVIALFSYLPSIQGGPNYFTIQQSSVVSLHVPPFQSQT